MNGLWRRLVQNGVIHAVAQIAALGTEALMIRALAPELYVQWGLIMACALIAVVVAQGGYQTSAISLFARCRSDGDRDVRTTLRTAGLVWLVLSIPVAAILWFVLPAVAGPLSGAVLCAAIAATLFRAANTALGEALRGIDRVGWAAALGGTGPQGGAVRAMAFGIGLLVLLRADAVGLASVLWLSAAVSALAGGCAVVALLLWLPRKTGRSVRRQLAEDTPSNIQLMLAQLLQLGTSRHAALIAGGVVGLGSDLAALVLVLTVAQIAATPTTLVNGALPGLLLKARRDGTDTGTEAVLRHAAGIALALTCATLLCLLATGPDGLTLVFGPIGTLAWPLLLCLVPGILANSYGGPAARALALLGEERAYMQAAALMAVMAVPLYLGAARFGPIGLVAAVSLVTMVENAVLVATVRNRLGLRCEARLRLSFGRLVA